MTEEMSRAKAKCICGHDLHEEERCRTAISVLPMKQCECEWSRPKEAEGGGVESLRLKCWACDVPIEPCGKTGWLHVGSPDDEFDHEAHPVGRDSNDFNEPKEAAPEDAGPIECSKCHQSIVKVGSSNTATGYLHKSGFNLPITVQMGCFNNPEPAGLTGYRLDVCPFCGEIPQEVHTNDLRDFYVGCANEQCSVQPETGLQRSEEAARNEWNWKPEPATEGAHETGLICKCPDWFIPVGRYTHHNECPLHIPFADQLPRLDAVKKDSAVLDEEELQLASISQTWIVRSMANEIIASRKRSKGGSKGE